MTCYPILHTHIIMLILLYFSRSCTKNNSSESVAPPSAPPPPIPSNTIPVITLINEEEAGNGRGLNSGSGTRVESSKYSVMCKS